jgi:hypothetical protein
LYDCCFLIMENNDFYIYNLGRGKVGLEIGSRMLLAAVGGDYGMFGFHGMFLKVDWFC